MAVALYSGSLTQFFLGTWIDDLPADGDAASVDGGAEEGEVEPEPQDVLKFFESFREQVSTQLSAHAKEPPRWTESVDGPRSVAVLETEEYGALMLFAARVAARGQIMPGYNRKRDWSEDPAVRTLLLSERDVGAMHHLVKADTWLPAEFLPIALAKLPYADVRIGSLPQLALALEEVGKALEAPDASVGMLPTETVAAARRAFDAFVRVLAHARSERLPMVADV